MTGDDAVRHCAQCNLNVYNVEHLTSYEVREMLMKREGRVCMRFFKRFDGTVLTQDCPRGLAAVKPLWQQTFSRVSAMQVGVLTAVALVGVFFVAGLISLFAENIRRLESVSGDMQLGTAPMAQASRQAVDADARAAVLTKFHAAPPCATRRAPEP
jgi:hypothetical protein